MNDYDNRGQKSHIQYRPAPSPDMRTQLYNLILANRHNSNGTRIGLLNSGETAMYDELVALWEAGK